MSAREPQRPVCTISACEARKRNRPWAALFVKLESRFKLIKGAKGMSNSRDAVTADSLKGMAVLSLASGNKIGRVEELFLYPENGTLSGLSLAAGSDVMFVPHHHIHSFGQDAIMVQDEQSLAPVEAFEGVGRNINKIFGARVISEAGYVLGSVSQIYVTLKPPPAAIFEVSKSVFHKFFGRVLYIPASAGHALSDDSQRLVIPDSAAKTAVRDIRAALEQGVVVRSFDAAAEPRPVAVTGDDDEDKTVVRRPADEDETVVRMRDEDETVVRMPRKAG